MSSLFDALFFVLLLLLLLRRFGKGRKQNTTKREGRRRKKTFVVLSLCVERASRVFRWTTLALWCRKEREREGTHDGTPFIFPQRTSKALRERDDDAVVVFSVGLRVRRPGTRGAVGRRDAPRTKAARRFGGNNNNTTTLAGWSVVDQRRALPKTRQEDTHDGVKIRRGDVAPVAGGGGGVFLR